MLKTPCEFMQWQGLPLIRKEIVTCMINNHGLSQKEAAEKLGVTPAAVSQYLSHKRARFNVINENILSQINLSAERVIKQGSSVVPDEICKICKILQKQGMLSFNSI